MNPPTPFTFFSSFLTDLIDFQVEDEEGTDYEVPYYEDLGIQTNIPKFWFDI